MDPGIVLEVLEALVTPGQAPLPKGKSQGGEGVNPFMPTAISQNRPCCFDDIFLI